MDIQDFASIVSQTMRISIPYLMASLGGTLSERTGVVNIGLEGILLGTAFAAGAATCLTGSPWLGMGAALLMGFAIAALHAFVTVTFKADQIISGLAINMLADGATRYCLRELFGSDTNSPRFDGPTLGPLGTASDSVSALGSFASTLMNPLVILAGLTVIAAQFLLFHTVLGLRMRAVGENPEAADSLGISVAGLRWLGVLLGGAATALGGAWMAFDQHQFTAHMSGGRGYIALAAMIIGKWSPKGALVACVVFGFAETMQIRLQGSTVSGDILQMIPYVLTIIVLCGWLGRSVPPAADGVPYEKERAE